MDSKALSSVTVKKENEDYMLLENQMAMTFKQFDKEVGADFKAVQNSDSKPLESQMMIKTEPIDEEVINVGHTVVQNSDCGVFKSQMVMKTELRNEQTSSNYIVMKNADCIQLTKEEMLEDVNVECEAEERKFLCDDVDICDKRFTMNWTGLSCSKDYECSYQNQFMQIDCFKVSAVPDVEIKSEFNNNVKEDVHDFKYEVYIENDDSIQDKDFCIYYDDVSQSGEVSEVIAQKKRKRREVQFSKDECDITDEESDDSIQDKDFCIDNYDEDSLSSVGSKIMTSNQCERDEIEEQSTHIRLIDEAVSDTVENEGIHVPFHENIKKNRKTKLIRCKFCSSDIGTKNFMRHIERHHSGEKEVQTICEYPKGSKARRQGFALLRHNTNFDLYIKGVVRPTRRMIHSTSQDSITYYPCTYCKGLFSKAYLRRHSKVCFSKKEKQGRRNENSIGSSQTLMACVMDTTNTIAKLNVKEKVFDLMKGDDIAFVAKKDLLIAHFGESYLKKLKRGRSNYICSNRMRELARLLIHCQKLINNENAPLKDVIHPKKFKTVLQAVKEISGYNHEKKSFKAPTLAMHMGTSLKLVCEELTRLILKENEGFKCTLENEKRMWLNDVKNFKKLVDTRWKTELSSLANRYLLGKRWNKTHF